MSTKGSKPVLMRLKADIRARAQAYAVSRSLPLSTALRMLAVERLNQIENTPKMNVAPAATLDGKQQGAANTPAKEVLACQL